MHTNVPVKTANPLRAHAFRCIRLSGYLSVLAAILFLATLPSTPHSLGYWFTAATVGVVSLPLLWRHWCRPNQYLFFAIIMLLVISRSSAERTCFPGLHGGISGPLFVQYLGLYFFVELALVFAFRHRLRKSIDRHLAAA